MNARVKQMKLNNQMINRFLKRSKYQFSANSLRKILNLRSSSFKRVLKLHLADRLTTTPSRYKIPSLIDKNYNIMQ